MSTHHENEHHDDSHGNETPAPAKKGAKGIIIGIVISLVVIVFLAWGIKKIFFKDGSNLTGAAQINLSLVTSPENPLVFVTIPPKGEVIVTRDKLKSGTGLEDFNISSSIKVVFTSPDGKGGAYLGRDWVKKNEQPDPNSGWYLLVGPPGHVVSFQSKGK